MLLVFIEFLTKKNFLFGNAVWNQSTFFEIKKKNKQYMAQVNVNISEKRGTMCSVVFESKCEQFNFFDHFIWSLYYLFAKNKIPCNPISYTLYGTRTEMCVPISTIVGDCMNDPLAIPKMRRGNTNVERIKYKYSETTKNHQIRVEKKCCLFLFYSPVEFGQMYLLRSVKHILYISMSDKFSPSCILNCIVFFSWWIIPDS